MKGRKQKPLSLKKLEGDIHKERWNVNQPQPEVSIPPCPSFLHGLARKEWKRITPELYILGLITKLDRAALAGYCAAWGTYAEVQNELRKIEAGGGDPTKVRLLERISSSSMKLCRKFLVEFGMTPASRRKLFPKK